MARRAVDNPAQRLKDILDRWVTAREEKGNQGYDAVWAEALGVTTAQVTSHVASALGLIPQIEGAVALIGDKAAQAGVDRYREEWATAFIPPSPGRGGAVSYLPSSDSLIALGAIASILRAHMPKLSVPDVDAAADLHEVVRTLVDDLLDDETLPDELRQVMAARLNDMLWALAHVQIGGAEAIDAALDRLWMAYAASYAYAQTNVQENPGAAQAAAGYAQRVHDVAQKGVALISAPGAVYSTWELIAPYAQLVAKAITG